MRLTLLVLRGRGILRLKKKQLFSRRLDITSEKHVLVSIFNDIVIKFELLWTFCVFQLIGAVIGHLQAYFT